jgi:hypothetical protein
MITLMKRKAVGMPNIGRIGLLHNELISLPMVVHRTALRILLAFERNPGVRRRIKYALSRLPG